jgi:chorismate lyase/3-hydroxybenzoate synthase
VRCNSARSKSTRPFGRGGADGIELATETAYRRITAFLATHGYPHMLRMWNYFDDITGGEGDDERYRRFCVGRARAIGAIDPAALPAATAIGRATGDKEQGEERRLQVYWLAARASGTPVENPRQVSAYRYPRQYGPQSPGFARAMLPPAGGAMPLMLSGTAAIVGHESQHRDDVEAQLDEVLANLDSLIGQARAQGGRQPEHFGAGSRLKVYVRDRDDIPRVQARTGATVAGAGAAHRAACGGMPARAARGDRRRARRLTWCGRPTAA